MSFGEGVVKSYFHIRFSPGQCTLVFQRVGGQGVPVQTWSVMAVWLGCQTLNQRVVGSIPCKGTA
jgi:hypothetical protein